MGEGKEEAVKLKLEEARHSSKGSERTGSQKQRGVACPEGCKECVRLQYKILGRVLGNENRGKQGEPLKRLKQHIGMVRVQL